MTEPIKPPDTPGRREDDGETGVAVKIRTRTKKPSMYKVLMLNDDYTPMEFVVYVLQRYFKMPHERATQIMLHVHQRGVGVCGVCEPALHGMRCCAAPARNDARTHTAATARHS